MNVLTKPDIVLIDIQMEHATGGQIELSALQLEHLIQRMLWRILARLDSQNPRDALVASKM